MLYTELSPTLFAHRSGCVCVHLTMGGQALRLVTSSALLKAPKILSVVVTSNTRSQIVPFCSCWGACQFHSSPGSSDTAEGEAHDGPETSSSPSTNTSADSSTSSSSSARGPVHARHISLDDPELNIRLTYNKKFVMDADRQYAIGQANHLDRQTSMELRKALAAQRLQLRDAAAAAPSTKQLPLRDQMLARLTELQQVTRR